MHVFPSIDLTPVKRRMLGTATRIFLEPERLGQVTAPREYLPHCGYGFGG